MLLDGGVVLVAEAVVEAVLEVSEMIKDKIPERPLVTEWLAALDSTGNDCTLARYVLYLEDELARLREENAKLRKSLSIMANVVLGYIIDDCERDETMRILLQPEINKLAELLKLRSRDNSVR